MEEWEESEEDESEEEEQDEEKIEKKKKQKRKAGFVQQKCIIYLCIICIINYFNVRNSQCHFSIFFNIKGHFRFKLTGV